MKKVERGVIGLVTVLLWAGGLLAYFGFGNFEVAVVLLLMTILSLIVYIRMESDKGDE